MFGLRLPPFVAPGSAAEDGAILLEDLCYINIEEDDLAKAIARTGRRLALVHLGDSNRFQPGAGHIDFGSVFTTLHAIGYDGWLTLESRPRGEPAQAFGGHHRLPGPHLRPR
jgi:sugar phosphate isomerase/epimerase